MSEQSIAEISNEIQRLLQLAVLSSYPNPAREGCPGETTLRAVSRRHVPVRDAQWEHITHCSPCFQQFLEYRNDLANLRRRLVLRNRLILGAAFASVAIAAVLVLPIPSKPPQHAVAVAALVTIDMRPFSATRGESDNHATTPQYAGVLPRSPVQLNVILPIGAEEGDYEVWLMDEDRQKTLITATAPASLRDHLVRYKVRFDLTAIPAGRYVLASRRTDGGWLTAPVLVR